MAKYELSEEEVRALLEFINAGVKVGGLGAAKTALILANILSNPLKEDNGSREKKNPTSS